MFDSAMLTTWERNLLRAAADLLDSIASDDSVSLSGRASSERAARSNVSIASAVCRNYGGDYRDAYGDQSGDLSDDQDDTGETTK